VAISLFFLFENIVEDELDFISIEYLKEIFIVVELKILT